MKNVDRPRRWQWLGALVVAVALGGSLAACADDPAEDAEVVEDEFNPNSAEDEGEFGNDDDLASDNTSHRFASEAFIDAAPDLVDEEVEVTGEALELIGDEAILVGNTAADPVLVLYEAGTDVEVAIGDAVTVVGVVATNDRAEAEAHFGTEFDDVEWADLEAEYLIYADTITRSE